MCVWRAQVCVGVIRRLCAHVLYVGTGLIFTKMRSYLLPPENPGGGGQSHRVLSSPLCQGKAQVAAGGSRWNYGCFNSFFFCSVFKL